MLFLVIRHQQKLFRLTNTEKEQVQLNSIRQMFTYLSSIIVFLLAGVIIKTKEDGNNELTWDDCWSMQSLCYIISAIGLATTVLFQLFTPEKATSTNMLESTMVATIRLKLFQEASFTKTLKYIQFDPSLVKNFDQTNTLPSFYPKNSA